MWLREVDVDGVPLPLAVEPLQPALVALPPHGFAAMRACKVHVVTLGHADLDRRLEIPDPGEVFTDDQVAGVLRQLRFELLGIGPEDELGRLGIEVAAALPVGEGLRDHFGIPVRFAPTEAMAAELAEHRARRGDPTTQGVFKARTSSCPEDLWDLHLLAAVFPVGDELVLASSSMLLQADWSGQVRLRSDDPDELPDVTQLNLATGADLESAMEGVELARAHNVRERDGDPTGHAELVAVRAAASSRGHWRLDGCTIFVTLEPCAMCAGALVNARITRLVYGVADPKAGAVTSLFEIGKDLRLNHRFVVDGGVLADSSIALLRAFFAELRARGEK